MSKSSDISKTTGTGMIIGIVAGVVSCLGITGALVHKHNKKKAGNAFTALEFNTFIDNEIA
jgi:hypothetical protein